MASDATILIPMFGSSFSINPSRYITIFGHNFYWYGIIIAAGFLLALLYVFKRCRKFGLTDDNMVDMLIITVPCAIIGARLYYVIFNFDLYRDNLSEIYKIWNGGLGIYGAIIVGLIVIVLFCKKKKLSVGAMLDISSIALIIGQAIGRWGNFINREAYGMETNVLWKMGLKLEAGKVIYVHPIFLYESLWNIAGFFILHSLSKKRKFDGQVFFSYVAWYGLGRFFVEGIRNTDDVLFLFNTGLRVSQLVAALSFCAAIVILFYNFVQKKHDPSELFVNRVGFAVAGNADLKEAAPAEAETIDNGSDSKAEEDDDGWEIVSADEELDEENYEYEYVYEDEKPADNKDNANNSDNTDK